MTYPGPIRGETPLAVGNDSEVASDSSTARSATGTRHSRSVERETVATRRRPSALAASDVYCSRPVLMRRGTRRFTSDASHELRAPLTVLRGELA